MFKLTFQLNLKPLVIIQVIFGLSLKLFSSGWYLWRPMLMIFVYHWKAWRFFGRTKISQLIARQVYVNIKMDSNILNFKLYWKLISARKLVLKYINSILYLIYYNSWACPTALQEGCYLEMYKKCIHNWPLPIGAFQDQCKQLMINKFSNKHNPDWREVDQLAIYKCSGEVELGATENNIS